MSSEIFFSKQSVQKYHVEVCSLCHVLDKKLAFESNESKEQYRKMGFSALLILRRNGKIYHPKISQVTAVIWAVLASQNISIGIAELEEN